MALVGAALSMMGAAPAVAVADTTPPTCVVTSVSPGPPEQTQVTVGDTGSGLASIVVTRSENADTVVPPFTAGTTDPVLVTSTKIDQTRPSRVTIRLTDVAGNITTCDAPPITAEVKVRCAPFTNSPAGITYKCEAVVAARGPEGVLDAPTGTVEFYANTVSPGTRIASCTLAATPGTGGISTCRVFGTSPIPNGPQVIVAAYSGDGAYPAATGSDTVGSPRPKTGPHPSDTGVLCARASDSGTLTCHVVVSDDDRGNDPEPVGTANLTVGASNVGSCLLVPIGGAGGQTACSITTSAVSSGSTVLATYTPSTTFYATSSDSTVV